MGRGAPLLGGILKLQANSSNGDGDAIDAMFVFLASVVPTENW